MTRFLRDCSIATKSTMINGALCLVTLLLSVSAFVMYDMNAMRAAEAEKLNATASMLAFNSSAVVTFQDAAAAKDLLRFVKSQPTVDFACIYGLDEKPLAICSRSDNVSPPVIESHRSTVFLDHGRIGVTQPIMEGGDIVGVVHVQGNSHDLESRLSRYLKIASLISMCSLTGVILLSLFVQRWFTQPLFKLAKTAESIRNDGDYSLRLQRDAKDELGVVYRAINDMLDRIESSQQQLQHYSDGLEQAVKERTSQLETEVERHKRTLYELRTAKDAAEAANQIKTEFLANMSHEIRTPMNAILGFSRILLEKLREENDTERLEFAETICRSGDHLLSLINDILDISKIESGCLEVEQIEFSPHEVISEVTSILRVSAEGKGISLDYNWNGSIPEVITSDMARVRQLLINLVGNAIKFTEDGGVRVELQLAGEVHDPSLKFSVIDTGIGIPSSHLPSIFDAFSQADSSVTRRFGGTGLGLAISQRIAEALGGKITVESEIGAGSVFTVEIPTGKLSGVRLLEAPQGDIPRPSRTKSQIASVKLPACRILLVEDGETNRKLATILLKEAGATVDSAVNGKIALDLALKQDFDLILMDMQMPIMDGYTATNRLRKSGSKIPIIALTAHALVEDREKCISAGCDDFITKPVNEKALLSTINRWLRSSDDEDFDSPSEMDKTCDVVTNDGSSSNDVAKTHSESVTDSSSFGSLPYIESTLPTHLVEYCEAINEFVEKMREQVDEMEAAAAAKNFQLLRELAHWAKGSGGTAGFNIVTTPATELGIAARAEDIDAVNRQIASLKSIASRLRGPSEQPVSS